jgi:uncharacterized protein YbjQ (UPF0145 family)
MPPAQADDVVVVTANEVPGHRITIVHGDVYGLVVRARDYFANVGASLRTFVGGEAAGYTKLLAMTRDTALARMREQAAQLGANAVIAARVDTASIGDIMNEVAAYGTAVTVVQDENQPSVELRTPARRAAERSFAPPPLQAGQLSCATPGCDAEGLPTPLAFCDVCGQRTVMAT